MSMQRFNQLLRLGVSPQAADEYKSLYKGGGKTTESSTTNATQDSTSTPTQSAQYGNLLTNADSWLSNGGTGNGWANNSTQQQANVYGSMINGTDLNGIYTTAGKEALWQILGNYDPNNTGLTSAINASNNALDYNYNTTVAPQVTQGAVDTGQYGSTRSGVAQGIALSNLSQQKVNAGAQLAYQDQQAFNNNRLQAYQNLNAITQGINSGNQLSYDVQEQDRLKGMAAYAAANGYQLQDLLAYKQLISGDMGGTTNTVTNSSTTSVGKTSGGGNSALGTIGTIGGAILGGIYGGPAGAAAGASVGGSVGGAIGG